MFSCASVAPASNEGPIRSRLVENGHINEVEGGKGVRQGNAPAPRARNYQQDSAEQSANPGPQANPSRPVRAMVRSCLFAQTSTVLPSCLLPLKSACICANYGIT